MIPNTQIKAGELKENHLEKLSKAWRELKLPIHNTNWQLPIDEINKYILSLKEFEITPDPAFHIDNKLTFRAKYDPQKILRYHIEIHPGDNSIKNQLELKEKYDKLIRSYHLR